MVSPLSPMRKAAPQMVLHLVQLYQGSSSLPAIRSPARSHPEEVGGARVGASTGTSIKQRSDVVEAQKRRHCQLPDGVSRHLLIRSCLWQIIVASDIDSCSGMAVGRLSVWLFTWREEIHSDAAQDERRRGCDMYGSHPGGNYRLCISAEP